MSTSYSAYGTLLKRGDGGVGAGVKATYTFGTGDSALKVTALTAGTAGNGISVTIATLAGTESTVTASGNDITITPRTSGTPNDVCAAFLDARDASAADSVLRKVTMSNGAGLGTGVIVAASKQNLATGAAGAEVFTTVDGVRNLSGPSFSMDTIDATHHTSPSNYRESLPSFLSGGEVSFDLLYDPADAQHEGILTDFEGRIFRNFQMIFPDAGNATHAFKALVTGAEVGAPIDNALTLAVKLTISGPVTRTA